MRSIAGWNLLQQEIVNCRACPRLVAYREEVARVRKRAYRDWEYWGRPVPGFGDREAWLLIVGLAPAAHGANRTGRMFTGDGSGATLTAALYRAGLASQPISDHRDDGLDLWGVFETAVVRCAPPGNRPFRQEIENCLPFLEREMALLPNLQAVLALGQVALDGYRALLRRRGVNVPPIPFRHGAVVPFPPPLPTLLVSYHPSRQNTQTGRLTPQMLDEVLQAAIREHETRSKQCASPWLPLY
ncbi:MAG: uracil-DNA glycosylase [Anaerolineae bacterium]|nr:uracil-DNA glycosylase [Anaerolineae bacterium]MDW8067631.1 uracil-DNA glycosylase [Anaerolineae bacterium]